MTAYTARAVTADKLQRVITQTAHGFVIGNIVRFNGVDYVLAQADNFTNAQTVGMVSFILNANQFVLTPVGHIANIPLTVVDGGPLVSGGYYYLSETVAGALSTTPPTNVGEVIANLFIADSTTSGWYYNNDGDVIGSGSIFSWTTVTMNTNMAVNQGYIVNGGGSINLLLPATSAVGDVIEIATLGVNGCVITQNAGQSINIVDDTSTVGAGGTVTLQATNGVLSGGIRLLCLVANTTWKGSPGSGIWNPA